MGYKWPTHYYTEDKLSGFDICLTLNIFEFKFKVYYCRGIIIIWFGFIRVVLSLYYDGG